MPLDHIQGATAIERDAHHVAVAAERSRSKFGTSQENKLFYSLNQFIELVSNEATRAGIKERTKGGSDKYVSNFLRLNLLSYLRQLQQNPDRCEDHREVLIQWWVTLLNFLNSDLIPNESGSRSSSTLFVSFPDPMLSIETVSVCLECVSRLMSSLMIRPMHRVQQTEIYSHHVLLTIHYVTNRLILIAKNSKQPSSSPSGPNGPSGQAFLHFLNNYSSLLRSFLGKLNAYAFFYLPDEFHYDTQALLAITPDVTFQDNDGEKVFIWKKRLFYTPKNSKARLDPSDLDTRDTKFFKIVVSYLRNDTVLMAFYWHYWYIVLRYIDSFEPTEDSELNIDLLPGASILLEHVTCSSLRCDLNRFAKFVRSTSTSKSSSNSGFNVSDTMPDSSAATTDNFITNEMLNEFIFSNFSILSLWQCLRSLAGCFQHDSNMNRILRLHDSSQLKHIIEISAYDHCLANVIYNKVLQFIVFQFESCSSADFLNWDIWSQGTVAMLHTLNANCQVVALLCLFNNWTHMPSAVQNHLTCEILDNLWASLTIDCDFQLSKVLFFKLLIFRVLPTADIQSKESLKKKLQDMFDEVCFLDKELDGVDRGRKQDVLLFYGNRKFSLLQIKPRDEEDLIYRAERELKSKLKRNYQNFPTVFSTANVRPSVILKGGRYPYDVFDEMVVKAALLLAEKKRKVSEAPLPKIETSYSSHVHQSMSADSERAKTAPSISSALGSWFSKLSSNTDNRMKKLGTSPRRNSQKSTNSEDDRASEGEVSLPSCRSSDMLSMYSTVSSLATGRTNASDDQLGVADRNAVSHKLQTSKVSANSDRNQVDQGKKKKKLLSPVELKYTSAVAEHAPVTTLFKAVNVPCESLLSKIEKANVNWSVVTARTYDKPLPKPVDAVDTFIEEMRSNSLQSLENVDVTIDHLQPQGKASNESTLLSNLSDNSFLPRPDYSILSLGNEVVSTTDSELALRMKKLTLDVSLPDEPPTGGFDGSSSGLDDEKARRLRTLRRNRKMHLETRLMKLSTLLRMFNQTAGEYYEHLNFMDHGSIFLEFEIKAQLTSPYMPDQFKRST